MEKHITFYLIRHGRTEWNDQGLLQGSGNSALTKLGIECAKLTGIALQNIPFIAAYSSCLQRTIDTANYIISNRFIPFFQHQGLNEQHFGCWEGVSIENLRNLDEFNQMLTDPKNYKAQSNGGETFEQLAKRAMKAIHDIIQIHQKGNILVISHGHTLRLLLSLFQGTSWQEHRDKGKSEPLLNTAINIVSYQQSNNSDGRFSLIQLNDIHHLSQY